MSNNVNHPNFGADEAADPMGEVWPQTPEDQCCPYHATGGDPDLGCFTVEPAANKEHTDAED